MQDGRDPGRVRVAASGTTYAVKDDDPPPLGTLIRRELASHIPVPPDLSYKELSPAQQEAVASWYPALAPGDEPPYPVKGPAEFYKVTSHAVGMARARGSLTVYVLVGTDGKARNVTAIGLDDPDVRKYIATAAGLVQYKPAICAGQPCEMIYPYRLALGPTP